MIIYDDYLMDEMVANAVTWNWNYSNIIHWLVILSRRNGVVYIWPHAIFDNFWDPLPIVTLFSTKDLVLLLQNPWPLPHKAVTTFMDDPNLTKERRILGQQFSSREGRGQKPMRVLSFMGQSFRLKLKESQFLIRKTISCLSFCQRNVRRGTHVKYE